MKVHLISNMYPDKENPSFGVFVKNTEDILKDDGLIVDRSVIYKKNNRLSKLLNYAKLYFLVLLKGLFKNYDVTYVHFASLNAFPLLLLKKVKRNIVICTNIHGSDVSPKNTRQEKLQKWVCRLLKESDYIISPSYAYKKMIKEKFDLSNPIHVFPSGGINPTVFKEITKSHVYSKLKLDPTYDYLGYVSRIDEKKGWDNFLEAIFLMKKKGIFEQKKAIIVGNGSQIDQFHKKIDLLNLKNDIIYFDILPHDELCDIYNALDVFCFPSHDESLGLVGLEAMACGTPVIGSRVGGITDYLCDAKNGFLFEKDNVNELVEKIEDYFLLNEEKKQNMKILAKKTANKYSSDIIKNDLADIFKKYKGGL